MKQYSNTIFKLLSTAVIFAFSLCSPVAFAQVNEMEQDMFESMKNGDKAAVIAVHFGATEPAALSTIDRFNNRIRQSFPDCDFMEAWTSRELIKQMENNGKHILTPDELLIQLEKNGYTHVLIQSSNIINGIEMQYLRYVVENAKSRFKHIRLGEPLLSDLEDYENVIKAASTEYRNKEANILVCHGSSNEPNAQYTMLDYALHDNGKTNWFVSTIEGYPSFDSTVSMLKAQKQKKVNLIPFLFTAGSHDNKDIAEDFAKKLQKAGYKVSKTMKSLGEIDAIVDIFIEHAKHAALFRKFNAKEIKMQSR